PFIYTLSLHDALPIFTLFMVASGGANTSLIVGNTGIFGWPPVSWNPNVSCPVVLGDLRTILGSAYPNQSLVGSPYQVNATDGGIDRKSTRLNSSHVSI